MAKRWGNSERLYFRGLRNHCRWWLQPWNQKMLGPWKKSYDQPAAAKLFQSCWTLSDRIDGSPLGSPVPGILQARTLEWVAISFSKWRLADCKCPSWAHLCPTSGQPVTEDFPQGTLRWNLRESTSRCSLSSLCQKSAAQAKENKAKQTKSR